MSDSILTKKQLLLEYNITTLMLNKIFYLIKNDNGYDTKIKYSFTDFIHHKKWALVVDVLNEFKLSLNDDYKNFVSITENKNGKSKVKLVNHKNKKYITPIKTNIIEKNIINIDNNKKNIRNILINKGLILNY